MKNYGIQLGLGILNCVIPLLFLIVSNDVRLFFSAALFVVFFTGILSNRWKVDRLIALFLLIAPLVSVFAVLLLSQVSSGVYLIAPWMASLFLGFFWESFRNRNSLKAFGLLMLILVPVVYCVYIIPQLIRSSLSKELNEKFPSFNISRLDGSALSSSQFKGKVIVVDFFGTWCGPCLLELPELEIVKKEFQGDSTVVFLIIDNDSHGDSPEKVKVFKAKLGFDLDFFYDHEGSAHKLFGFKGVPILAIIDSNGNIRFRKEGYSKAEGDFKEYLTNLIKRVKGI